MSKITDIFENHYPDNIQALAINSVVRNNGDFNFVGNLKELIINDYFKEQDNLWEFLNTSASDFSQVLFEGVSNMMENISDIDMCHLSELMNVAKLLGVNDLHIFNLPFTEELSLLIDTYSVNREYILYGKHSLTDLNEIFGTTDAEQINNAYLSELVDKSFEETFSNALYDILSESGAEHLAFIELIVPDIYLTGNDYAYCTAVRAETTVKDVLDSDHYAKINDGDMIKTAALFMRNYCIKILMLRETMKSIAQKNSIIGTQRSIEKMLTEYVIKEYSNIEELGFYVPNKSEEDILNTGINNDPFKSWTKFLSNIGDLGAVLNIELVEYYDTTEYMNITPDEITYKTESIPVTGWYSEPYLNISGDLAYADPIQQIIGYEDSITDIPEKSIGNTRYWEETLPEEYTDDILSLFRRLGVITEDDDIEILLQFLSNLYDSHAQNDWSRLSGTDYVSDDDLQNMQNKYSGASGSLENAPWMNVKNTEYASIAPLPFLWNLIEKTFRVFPRLVQYQIGSSRQLSEQYENLVDIDGSKYDLYTPNSSGTLGVIIDSWRSYANEAFSYKTYHESEDNLDDTLAENKNAQIDGSFNMLALGDLLDVYNNPPFSTSGTYIETSGALNILSKYYENLT